MEAEPVTNEGDYGDESADALKADVKLDPKAAPVPGTAQPVGKTPTERIQAAHADMEEEHARQWKQNTLWRRILFWGVSGIVAGFVVLDALVILGYLWSGHVEAVVLSTWFGATVVQVVGLLLVITRHLFPNGQPTK